MRRLITLIGNNSGTFGFCFIHFILNLSKYSRLFQVTAPQKNRRAVTQA
jgi:hypothetical protein